MTFRERLAKEHPSYVDDIFPGGAMGCPHTHGYESSEGCMGVFNCTECWDREIPDTEPTNTIDVKAIMEEKEDIIDHPNHYTHRNMESIDEMELIFGVHAVIDFCRLNAWKYRYRASEKNGEEDLQKADWYINKIKELKDKYGFN